MKARVLIVGGTGFIGKKVVQFLSLKGMECVTLSRRSQPSDEVFSGVKHIQADITNRSKLKKAIEGQSFLYVINLAGPVDHSAFYSGGRGVIESHFSGVQNLLESLDKSSIARFVQIGSSDEYGKAPPPQKETLRELPFSPYSLAKMASTQMLQMLYRSEGFPVVILRLFLVYGEGQNTNRFLPQVISKCLEGEEFPVSGGEQLRDFCHISDVVRGIYASLTSKDAVGEVVNIASGVPTSIRDMVNLVTATIGSGQPRFGEIPYRPGENMELYADIKKAKSMLNWRSETSIKEGLKRTISWYERD